MYGVVLHEREGLVVFDRSPDFPPANQMIKQLVNNGRYDRIETGSLASLNENVRNIAVPSEAGRVETIR